MIPLSNILFLDIETVSQYPGFSDVPETWKPLWSRKAEGLLKAAGPDATVETVYERAGLYAEFGKIVCISCGILQLTDDKRILAVKSFYGDDEKKLLGEFCEMLNKWTPGPQKYLCAHNGKDFDFPYLSRRMVINDECIPSLLVTAGKKPWETNFLDTMELWKFGEYKSYISLNLLAHVLGIPTPKDDIDGSQVGAVYWSEQDLPRIVEYCQKDVITTAQIYLRLNREPGVPFENIEIK